jgi:hypothetical protein
LPVAVTLNYLTRSGGESEIVRVGVSLVAPFRESGREVVIAPEIAVSNVQLDNVTGFLG